MPQAAICMLLAVVTLPALAQCHSGGGHESRLLNNEFMEKFSYKIMMDSCYGKAKVNEWYKWVDTQITACYLEAKAAKQKHAADMQDAAVTETEATTDEPFYSVHKIRYLKNKIVKKISFVNCTMNKMNITVTADGAIDVADIVEYFQGLEMLAALKAELVEGIKHCATKQPCASETDTMPYTVIDADFVKKVAFLKCDKDIRVRACVRHHMRENKAEFALSGLDGLLDDLKDDEERMLAVSSAFAMHSHMDLFL